MTTAHARLTDPSSSHQAAASITSERLSACHEAVLTCLGQDGPLTDEQLVSVYERRFFIMQWPRQSPPGHPLAPQGAVGPRPGGGVRGGQDRERQAVPGVEGGVVEKPLKPLGRKAYGSIGHLPGSRLGPADHCVNEGQALICTSAAGGRDVWVQAKLDGSCVAAALLDDGSLVALNRAGFPAESSPYPQHHMWADWVKVNEGPFRAVLKPGERIVGEWLALAHGTKYDLAERDPFVAFDLMAEDKRAVFAEFMDRVHEQFAVPDWYPGPMRPEAAMSFVDHYGALDGGEGVVYRVESRRKGREPRVDFLAKWVRPDKVDGCYLDPENEHWNWRP